MSIDATTTIDATHATTDVIEGIPQDVRDAEKLLADWQAKNLSADDLKLAEHDLATLVEQAPVVYKETKAGYKTTEFWGATVAAVLDVVTQIPFHDKLVLTIITALYALARGLAKQGVPHPEQGV